MSTHLLRELIKTETSQLVHTMCNCINFHQVQRQTIYIEKPKGYIQLKTILTHSISTTIDNSSNKQ
jgi:hypothetical protein